uniref:C2H2-type domain-containing protein n=1 Tax=viral metagenome TaxID=1070528 RepID=A0A6C0EG19_9ZZZZ
MELLEEKSRQKNGVTITCEKCSFTCKRKWDWNIHIKTAKHLSPFFGNKMETNHGILGENNPTFICSCGKKYNTQSGLWKHKKNSKNDVCNNHSEKPDNNYFIKYLMNENKELKNIIMEICKKNNTTTI